MLCVVSLGVPSVAEVHFNRRGVGRRKRRRKEEGGSFKATAMSEVDAARDRATPAAAATL